MLLKLEWKYLKRSIPGVGTLMGPIEDDLREAFFPELLEGRGVDLISDNPRP